MEIFQGMTASDLAAWWGAILATVVVVWDVYKWWKSGPQINLSAIPDMQTFGHPDLDGKTVIIIEASNVGDRASTITNVFFECYPSIWRRLLRKPEWFLVKNSTLPHKIEPGEIWKSFAVQSDDIDLKIKTQRLHCALFCSTSKRPIRQRIRKRQQP